MMRRARWIGIPGALLLMGTLVVGVGGSLAPQAAGADLTSRPMVWVSAQDAGQVVITQGTSILKRFDFIAGTPAGTPTVFANGKSPKPHLITFSPDGKFAYVSFQGGLPQGGGCACVAIIDTQLQSVVQLLTIPGSSEKTTQAKTTPDGKFLFVSQLGDNGVTIAATVTKFAVDEVHETWTELTQATFPLGQSPACFEFSPVTGSVYVDSSLSTFLGMFVLNPNTLAVENSVAFIGDPQCGMHDPITVNVNGTPQTDVFVSDSGTPTNTAEGTTGHVHLINVANDQISLFNPNGTFDPISARNFHDNWPVQLEPVGAPTSDPASTVYGSDRDSDVLMQINTTTGAINRLQMNPPDIVAGANTCLAGAGTPTGGGAGPCGRGAIDTLDGSGNTVFAAMKETGDLAIIDNFTTETFVHIADPIASCTNDPSNSATFHKCFTVHAVAVQPTLSTLVTGPSSGSTVVSSGQTLRLVNATVSGSVIVQRGGNLIATNSTIGSVSASGPASIRLCGNTINGSVNILSATGFVLVGDTLDDSCPINTISGSLVLENNSGGVDALNNKVHGAVVNSNNSGTGPFGDDTAPEISGNGP